jgi:hypothetical protein
MILPFSIYDLRFGDLAIGGWRLVNSLNNQFTNSLNAKWGCKNRGICETGKRLILPQRPEGAK